MLPCLLLLQVTTVDTLRIRTLEHATLQELAIDSSHLGSPQVTIPTAQGTALVWLLQAGDTVVVAASIPDTSASWGDDFVVSIDTRGDAGPSPQHDDFQLYFRRVLDSSVVYRGRNGRWEPPRNDPDWRIGAERSGGGWEVDGREERGGWSVLLRLDPAWLAGTSGRAARIAVRVHDNDPSASYAWPPPNGSRPPSSVESEPSLWIPVK